MPSDVVEKLREVERVVTVDGHIGVGGARATGVFLFLFFVFFFVLTADSVSVMYEKEKWDCSAEGRPT